MGKVGIDPLRRRHNQILPSLSLGRSRMRSDVVVDMSNSNSLALFFDLFLLLLPLPPSLAAAVSAVAGCPSAAVAILGGHGCTSDAADEDGVAVAVAAAANSPPRGLVGQPQQETLDGKHAKIYRRLIPPHAARVDSGKGGQWPLQWRCHGRKRWRSWRCGIIVALLH